MPLITSIVTCCCCGSTSKLVGSTVTGWGAFEFHDCLLSFSLWHILCFCEQLRHLQEASLYRQRAREEVQRRAREALRAKRSTTTLELSEELRIGDVSCKRGKPERPELVPSTLFVLWHGMELVVRRFGCHDMVVPMFQSQRLIKANAKIAMIRRLHLQVHLEYSNLSLKSSDPQLETR